MSSILTKYLVWFFLTEWEKREKALWIWPVQVISSATRFKAKNHKIFLQGFAEIYKLVAQLLNYAVFEEKLTITSLFNGLNNWFVALSATEKLKN